MAQEQIPLESVIVKRIMQMIKANGCGFVYKTHGSAYQRSGLPDITLIGKTGRFIGLEVKRPKLGKLTALQAKVLNDINKAGGYAAVVTSVEEAELAISRADNGAINTEEFKAT